MPTAIARNPTSHVFEVGTDHRFEVEHVHRTELDAHLKAADAAAAVWCFRCERSLRLGAVRVEDGGISCGYADCGGGPLDFWSWAAYRASWESPRTHPSLHGGTHWQHDVIAQDAP